MCARDAPIEVALLVEPAFDKPGDNRLTREWCAQLQDMYRAWAGKRNMQLAEIAGERPGDPPLLLISGFGAHRCLAQEVGLHVLDLAEDDKRGSRATVRVCLTVAPLGDVPEHQAARPPAAGPAAAIPPAEHRAPLPGRSLAPGAQHERQRPHRPPGRRAAGRLRPDRFRVKLQSRPGSTSKEAATLLFCRLCSNRQGLASVGCMGLKPEGACPCNAC